MHPDDLPDRRELQEIAAEQRQVARRRVQQLIRQLSTQDWADRWDAQNRLSIARGDGPLPF